MLGEQLLPQHLLHAARNSQRSPQCRQHRHDDVNQRLPKFLVLHNGYWLLFIGYCLLVIGYWLLVIG